MQERAYLEFEPDPVRFRHVEKFDGFAFDAVDLLDIFLRACPELDPVNLGPQADDRTTDLAACARACASG
jgi:hypothetical protein